MSFSRDMGKATAEIKGISSKWAREGAKALFTRVIRQSPTGQPDIWKAKNPPKGYVGGRFKGNWQFTKGTPAVGDLDLKDKEGDGTISKMVQGISTVNFNKEFKVFLTNNLPYSEELEEGHSTQVPVGWVRLNVMRIEEELNRRAS